MSKLYRVLLVGLGKMGFQYLDDPAISKSIAYSTHFQVIDNHPSFLLHGAIDTSEKTLSLFKERFKCDNLSSSIENIKEPDLVDVLVLATPPKNRYDFLNFFPNLKALIVEKPLGENLQESKILMDICTSRNLITQVNFCRRTDQSMKALAEGGLFQEIGSLQCGFGVYGNGILNYSIHTIDLVRMLIGEITKVQALTIPNIVNSGPIGSDLNIPFILYLEDIAISIFPINFCKYREGSLDLWGSKGRLQILQEGLKYHLTKVELCRSLFNFNELNSDKIDIFDTGFGKSMYYLYDEVSESIANKNIETSSPLVSCFYNEYIVDCIRSSYSKGGALIPVLKN